MLAWVAALAASAAVASQSPRFLSAQVAGGSAQDVAGTIARKCGEVSGGLRLRPDYWPERGGMDGFFMARLRLS